MQERGEQELGGEWWGEKRSRKGEGTQEEDEEKVGNVLYRKKKKGVQQG